MGWKVWPRVSLHWHSELSTGRKSSCLLGTCFLWDYRMNIFQRLITVSHLIICCCSYQVCSFDSNFQYKFLTVFSFKKTNQPTKRNNPIKKKKTDKNPKETVHWNKNCTLHIGSRRWRDKAQLRFAYVGSLSGLKEHSQFVSKHCQRKKFSQGKLPKQAQMANRRALNSGLHRGEMFGISTPDDIPLCRLWEKHGCNNRTWWDRSG